MAKALYSVLQDGPRLRVKLFAVSSRRDKQQVPRALSAPKACFSRRGTINAAEKDRQKITTVGKGSASMPGSRGGSPLNPDSAHHKCGKTTPERCDFMQGPQQMDVSSIFVDTAFRSTPWAQEAAEESSTDTSAKILFVSESNVCRSVMAQSVMRQLLQDRGLAEHVACDSKGTRCSFASPMHVALGPGIITADPTVLGPRRDYNAGEGPDATVLEVAHEAGIHLPADFRARQLQPEVDIVHYDLVRATYLTPPSSCLFLVVLPGALRARVA